MAEEAAGKQPRYVGFWMRVVAAVIDSLILVVVIVPLMIAIVGWEALAAGVGGGVAGFVLQYLLPAIAVIVFWRYRGATPGKMLISARIVDATTLAAPSTGKLVGRYFAYIVSTIPLCLGFLWIAFDARKQGWHDKLAGTVVVFDDDD